MVFHGDCKLLHQGHMSSSATAPLCPLNPVSPNHAWSTHQPFGGLTSSHLPRPIWSHIFKGWTPESVLESLCWQPDQVPKNDKCYLLNKLLLSSVSNTIPVNAACLFPPPVLTDWLAEPSLFSLISLIMPVLLLSEKVLLHRGRVPAEKFSPALFHKQQNHILVGFHREVIYWRILRRQKSGKAGQVGSVNGKE